MWKIIWGGKTLFYVGRTGDNSSINAGSPFTRIGQHLSFRASAKGNSLSKQLAKQGVDPRKCEFDMIAVGPIFEEEVNLTKHREKRDIMAALERDIAMHLKNRGLAVIGVHHSKKDCDQELLLSIVKILERQL